MWRRLIYHPEVNYALRQTLVLCLPVAVGLILGHLQQGLLFSLVPACCNIAGLDTPHKRFFKRLIIGGLLFCRCEPLPFIHIRSPQARVNLACRFFPSKKKEKNELRTDQFQLFQHQSTR